MSLSLMSSRKRHPIPDSYLVHYASPYYDPQKAHEYYMDHRKLKGRRSTSGLNDEGKQVAEYVKTQIDAERDQKISENKNELSENIDYVNSLIEELRLAGADEKEAKRDEINDKIEELKRDAAEKRERLNKALEEATKKENSLNKAKIHSLRDRLKHLGKGDIEEREQILREIGELEEDEASKNKEYAEKVNTEREKANSSLKTISDDLNSGISSLREEFKAFSNETNAITKESIASLRETIRNLKSESSEAIKKIKEDADSSYSDELDKILAEDKYLKKKSGSGGKKSSGTPARTSRPNTIVKRARPESSGTSRKYTAEYARNQSKRRKAAYK